MRTIFYMTVKLRRRDGRQFAIDGTCEPGCLCNSLGVRAEHRGGALPQGALLRPWALLWNAIGVRFDQVVSLVGFFEP
jgi:hypothetical protein